MAGNFGALLRRLREEAQVTLGALARALEVSTPYLSDVERGNRSPLSERNLREAARVLRLTPGQQDELLSEAAACRGFFELGSSDLSPAKQRLGAALARGWAEFDDHRVERLWKALGSEDSE